MSIKGKENQEDKVTEASGEIDNTEKLTDGRGLSHLLKHEADNLKSYYALKEDCDGKGRGADLLDEFCGITLKNIEKITKLIKGEKSQDKSE